MISNLPSNDISQHVLGFRFALRPLADAAKWTRPSARAMPRQSNEGASRGIAVGIRVFNAVASADRLPVTVAALWARRDMRLRPHLNLVATVRALIGAG